jgi:hypothetical protein
MRDQESRDDRPTSEQIAEVVASWPGVDVDDGELGELAFKVGRREIGHLHGDHVAHFSFPKATWQELSAEQRIEPHPVFPRAVGPAQRRIHDADDVHDVIALFRFNYDRVRARQSA